jgi:hypothetical protein
MRQPGRAVVLIKFPARENHGRQLEAYHASLRGQTHCSSLATLRTTVWIKQPTLRWFTIIDADDALIARAEGFVNALNGIDGCKGDINCATRTGAPTASEATVAKHRSLRKWQSRIPPAAEREGADQTKNVCPECGHRFKGKGFDGIDAHWRAKHEAIMPYAQAWPLVKSGNYRRSDFGPKRPLGKA